MDVIRKYLEATFLFAVISISGVASALLPSLTYAATIYSASTSFDAIQGFDSVTGLQVNQLNSANGAFAMAFGPDGNLYIGVGNIEVYDPSTGSLLRQITTQHDANAIAFSSGGDLFTTSTGWGLLEIINPITGSLINQYGTNCALDMAFGPDNNLYCGNGDVNVYEPITGTLLNTITTINDVNALAFDSNGNLFVASTSFNTIEVFDITTSQKINQMGLEDCAFDMAFGPDGNLYCANANIKVYNPLDGSFIRQIDTLHDTNAIAFAPVPIPAALWLLGSGLVGLIGVAKRKKV